VSQGDEDDSIDDEDDRTLGESWTTLTIMWNNSN
jgi:hypothetical protein